MALEDRATSDFRTQEVRLAMGWNGGGSLAIWMGGVAVELDCARRAHLSTEEDLTPARRIYNAACEAFDETLVLDVFTGASAGGLNSTLLGAAISKARRLHPDFLREKWLELGDLGALLHPMNAREPNSLMQGGEFKRMLDDTFKQLMETPPPGGNDLCALPEHQAGRLDPAWPPLDIQVTNVLGRQHSFVDSWNRELVAREHRAPFRFRASDDYKPELLAAAARASASFPAAFEPFEIKGPALALSRLVDVTQVQQPKEEYEPPVVARYAIDGGLLENAPIRQAIALIPTRPASGPVKRFVCYVNANPSSWTLDQAEQKPPTLRDVLSYVVNLPRTGRDIDQWEAIISASRRGRENAETVSALVELPKETLTQTANALLPTYRRRRAFAAVDEILSGISPRRKSDLVNAVVATTEDGQLLPWLPDEAAAPFEAASWNWGFRAAERVLFLQLDLLRGTLRHVAELPQEQMAYEQRAQVASIIFAARRSIDEAIGKIDSGNEAFLREEGLAEHVAGLSAPYLLPDQRKTILDVLEALYNVHRDDELYRPLLDGTAAFHHAVQQLQRITNAFPYAVDRLFGSTNGGTADSDPAGAAPTDEESVVGNPLEARSALSGPMRSFVERALLIEVVRRSFVDDAVIDSAQPFDFAQLAPNAAVRIFTEKPFTETGPANDDDKLCGNKFAHFSGFYRRSWRANDFMWGRLDAAARIIDFLVDPDWRQRLGPRATPWVRLAETLVPSSNDAYSHAQRTLIYEALIDVKANAVVLMQMGEIPAEVANHLEGVVSVPLAHHSSELQSLTRKILQRDLTASDSKTRGTVARVLLARAAQYEALRAELPLLAEAAQHDHRLGCFTKPFRWKQTGSLIGVIKTLRENYREKNPLPKQLGRDSPDEATSTLGVRTVSHTALVALAALPGLATPLSSVTKPARVPFLATAGVAAKGILGRVAVIASFSAASLYLTARVLTADNNAKKEALAAAQRGNKHFHHNVLLGELASPPVWAMGLAALVVLGVLLMPGLRAWRASSLGRHVVHGTSLLLLFATSGAAAVAVGWFKAGHALALTGSDGFDPGKTKIALAFAGAGIGILGASSLGRINKFLDLVRKAHGWGTAVIALVAASFVIKWSSPHVYDAVSEGGSWHSWHYLVAVLAFASMPLLALYVFMPSIAGAARVGISWMSQKRPAH